MKYITNKIYEYVVSSILGDYVNCSSESLPYNIFSTRYQEIRYSITTQQWHERNLRSLVVSVYRQSPLEPS